MHSVVIFIYVPIGFSDLFHGNPTLKCAEVVQPQMIDQAKYGDFFLSNHFVAYSSDFHVHTK